MKTIFLFSTLFSAIMLPALAELTDADLDKIRLIVKEEVTSETAKINDKIDKLDARLRTVETDMRVSKTEITNLKETFNNGNDDVQKNFDRQNNIIIACIGVPLAILAICVTVWGILANRRNPKVNEQQEQIEELKQEIQELKQQPAFSTGKEL